MLPLNSRTQELEHSRRTPPLNGERFSGSESSPNAILIKRLPGGTALPLFHQVGPLEIVLLDQDPIPEGSGTSIGKWKVHFLIPFPFLILLPLGNFFLPVFLVKSLAGLSVQGSGPSLQQLLGLCDGSDIARSSFSHPSPLEHQCPLTVLHWRLWVPE